MSSKTTVCRLCLAMDTPMRVLSDSPLQGVYEKLAGTSLFTRHWPVVACYLCHSQLRKCHDLMIRSVRANELLTTIQQFGGVLNEESVSMLRRLRNELSHDLCFTPVEITCFEKNYIKPEVKEEPVPSQCTEMEIDTSIDIERVKCESLEDGGDVEGAALEDVGRRELIDVEGVEDNDQACEDEKHEQSEGVECMKKPEGAASTKKCEQKHEEQMTQTSTQTTDENNVEEKRTTKRKVVEEMSRSRSTGVHTLRGTGHVTNKRRQEASSSPSRSGSVSPALASASNSRRAAKGRVARIMSDISDKEPNSLAAPVEPKLFRPSPPAVHKEELTPGGRHSTVGELMHLQSTPRGTQKNTPRGTQKKHLSVRHEEPYLLDVEERAEALGLDQFEIEEAMDEDDGIRTWIGVGAERPAAVIPGSSTSMAVASCSGEGQSMQVTTADVDVSPSVSGTKATSTRRVATGNASGSEYDSDYDDEFDPNVLDNDGAMARGVPDDDELDEGERTIVNGMERVIDEVLDDLVGGSAFVWHEDFDRFRGVPEQFSGPTPGPIKVYDTPYEAFIDIWDKDFMERIVLETNRYARQVIEAKKAAGTLKRCSRLHQWHDTDVDEMYRLLAIFILMGIDSRSSQHEYWETSGYLQMPLFRKLLPYDRYILLSKFLHFTDNSDVSQNLPSSDGVVLSPKLRKVAPVISHLNSKFHNLYNLRREIAIDESLTLFKGSLSWAQAIRSKAARFGIKSYELCESLTGYMYKFEIYTGKNSERDNVVHVGVDLAGKSAQVVLDLLKGLEGRGHLVAMDNFYNSPALARHLKGLGFDCLGTLRPNRKNVPEDVAKVPKNVAKGTIVARHSGDVSCIAWKDTKVVTMISTCHNTETYVGRKAGKELIKPIVVRDYNTTMGGVDLKDQKLSMYLLERKRCLKWYIKLFKRLFNVSVHNAFILLTASLKQRGKPYLTHRVFRKKLASSLVSAHMHSPPSQESPAVFIGDTRLNKNLQHCPVNVSNKDRKRCHICQRNDIIVFSNIYCSACTMYLCAGDCWRTWHYRQQLPGREVHCRAQRKPAGPGKVRKPRSGRS